MASLDDGVLTCVFFNNEIFISLILISSPQKFQFYFHNNQIKNQSSEQQFHSFSIYNLDSKLGHCLFVFVYIYIVLTFVKLISRKKKIVVHSREYFGHFSNSWLVVNSCLFVFFLVYKICCGGHYFGAWRVFFL